MEARQAVTESRDQKGLDGMLGVETMMTADAQVSAEPFEIVHTIPAIHDGGPGRPHRGALVLERAEPRKRAMAWSPKTHKSCPKDCLLLQSETPTDGKPVVICLVYRPPGDDEVHQFFDKLTEMILDLQRSYWVISVGDFNAHMAIHEEDRQKRDSAGKRMMDMIAETSMVRVEPQAWSPFTYYNMAGADPSCMGPFEEHRARSVIDHLLVSAGFVANVTKVHLDKEFTMGSDHVGIQFSVSVRSDNREFIGGRRLTTEFGLS